MVFKVPRLPEVGFQEEEAKVQGRTIKLCCFLLWGMYLSIGKGGRTLWDFEVTGWGCIRVSFILLHIDNTPLKVMCELI